MDRYERMHSGDWPQVAAPSNFRRMSKRARVTGEWLADAGRIALAVAIIAALAAIVR